MTFQLARRTLAVLAIGLATAACGDDSSGPESPADITGVYPLRTVNGDAMPATIVEIGTYKFEIVSGNLTINAGSTFSAAATFRETEDGQSVESSETCTGTYTRNGNSLTLTEAVSGESCGGTFTASINGTTITVAYDAGLQAVYRK